MVILSAISLTVYLFLSPVLFVDGAFDLDANRRFMYSIHRNWKQVFQHPSVERLLGLPRDVTLKGVDTITTAQGVKRCRMQQMYKGYQVISAGVEADVDGTGRYDKGVVTGRIVLGIYDDLKNDTCTYDKASAVSTVLQREGLDSNTQIQSKKITKNVYFKNKHAHYVHAVTIVVSTASGDKRPYYIIDCRSGKVLYHDERMQPNVVKRQQTYTTPSWDAWTGSTEGWSTGTYYPDTYTGTEQTYPTTNAPTGSNSKPTEPITSPRPTVPPGEKCSTGVNGFGGNKKMGKIDYSRSPNCLMMKVEGDDCILENQFVKTVDMKFTADDTISTPFRFKCSEGANDNINGAYSPLLDAHLFGTTTYMMFLNWYNTKPLNFQAVMMVHYKKRFENAFWDGKRMFFGDGFNEVYPMTSLDIIAHEMAHGVTEFSSNLNYEGQSGGMNEAFSDMAGEVAEAYYKNADFRVGFGIIKDLTGSIRYFKDPSRDGVSINYAKDFTEEMDVHDSSGVYNRAFYLAVKAGNVPIRYAFEAFLTANKIYWQANTDFQAGVCGVMRGAYDSGLEFEPFGDAFTEVGLTACKMGRYIEKLAARNSRKDLKVSSIRQPFFGIKTIASTKKIIVTATTASGTEVWVAVQSSMKRSSVLSEAVRIVVHPVSGAGQYYVRIYTQSDVEIEDVAIALEFE